VQSLLNLKANSVYFASPLQFNDPYDCALDATIAEPSPEEVEALRQHYLKRGDLPGRTKQEFETLSQERLRELSIGSLSKLALESKQRFLEEYGVCCFSEVNDNLLMWGHYGGRYKGWCLEFRTDYEPFQKLRRVIYSDRMPQISLAAFASDNGGEQFIDLLCTKSLSWQYEREWRALHKQAGTLFTYEPRALKAVYFGPAIEPQALEIVCLILGGQNPDVELWQGRRSLTEFRVEFKQVTYTPHIVAKNMGLIK
jgi:hypothetical protein